MKQRLFFFEEALKTESIALAYLEKRNISEDMIKKFRLGFCPNSTELWTRLNSKGDSKAIEQTGLIISDHMPRFGNRLIFPIRNKQGCIIAFGARSLKERDHPKYINSPENPYFKKKETLYGFYEGFTLEKKQKYIFVEGYFDVIALHQRGFTGAVASMGTALTSEQIQKIWRYDASPILCMDGDTAGKRATFRILEKSMPFLTPYKTLQVSQMPDDTDPDQLISQDPIAFQNIKKFLDRFFSIIVVCVQNFATDFFQIGFPELGAPQIFMYFI